MPAPVMSSIVRTILSEDLDLSADEVIQKAKSRGVTAPDRVVRTTAHNIKSELKKKAAKAVPVAAAARTTRAPEPAAVAASVPEPVSSHSGPDLTSVLANVALVNSVLVGCGGAEPARQVAAAVRACGGVESFLQHLDVVTGIRGPSPA
ncbi:hypothetical protein VT84_06300 [Gemmata sp. SH-PL17]|uniref:hypothetical protein n=1 Tax=Gemmata sp. SH-PL17 TaxID=1630693 RepID=UPI00078C7E42|nr:hypothetical protein [Gemmata sp. SH-PL17]AMV23987.1 hypothetical protein VT84_06300 [Gemmata sp. SH-PL17]